MAAFYADENIAHGVVVHLRRLGHDVLTAHEAGRSNQGIPDEDVPDFVRLHDRVRHAGIVVCTVDLEFERLATAIDAAVRGCAVLSGSLLRVNRPA